LLAKNGIVMDDVDLLEVNEAFASMMVYCVDKLKMPIDRLNVNGGAMCVDATCGTST
jgi:acetyl-CoA acetyltransferase